MELLSFYLLEHGKNAPILLPTYEVCAQRGGMTFWALEFCKTKH